MAEQIFRSPGFFEQEIDLSARVTTPSGTPAGVIGTADRGPAFVPVTIGSFADFETRLHGGDQPVLDEHIALRVKTRVDFGRTDLAPLAKHCRQLCRCANRLPLT